LLTLRHWAQRSRRALYDNPETRALMKPEAIWEIEGSFDMPAERVSEAAVARSDWYKALLTLFERYDVLALPTAQVFPFSAEVHWPDSIDGRSMDTYHRWMEVVIGGTLAGLPVVNLPVGFDARGRPMGAAGGRSPRAREGRVRCEWWRRKRRGGFDRRALVTKRPRPFRCTRGRGWPEGGATGQIFPGNPLALN